MKILFVSSKIENGKGHQIKDRILKHLQKKYHLVSTEIGNPQENFNIIFETSSYDMALIEIENLADPEVGFLAGIILSKGRPVIILYPKGREYSVLEDFKNTRLIASEYSIDELESVIEWCIDEARINLASRRFTMFISPDLEMFLNKVSNSLNTSKSEYIRDLILKEKEDGSPI